MRRGASKTRPGYIGGEIVGGRILPQRNGRQQGGWLAPGGKRGESSLELMVWGHTSGETGVNRVVVEW